MVALRLHFAQMHDVDRARLQDLEPCLLGGIGGLLHVSFRIGELAEMDRGAAIALFIEGREGEIGGAWVDESAAVGTGRRGARAGADRKSVVRGKSVSGSVEIGGLWHTIKKHAAMHRTNKHKN